MNMTDLFSLLPRLMPLMPRIDAALKTVERLEADPAVKDAIAVFEEVTAILKGVSK